MLFVILSCRVNPEKSRWTVHPQLESQRHQGGHLLPRKDLPWQSFLGSSFQQRGKPPNLCPRSLRRRSCHTGSQAASLWMQIHLHRGRTMSRNILTLLSWHDVTSQSKVHLYQVREYSLLQETLSLQVDPVSWQTMWTN